MGSNAVHTVQASGSVYKGGEGTGSKVDEGAWASGATICPKLAYNPTDAAILMTFTTKQRLDISDCLNRGGMVGFE